MVCANLREISRSFLHETSRLRIFVRGVNATKELFSWAHLYTMIVIPKFPNMNGYVIREILVSVASTGLFNMISIDNHRSV